MTGNSKLYPEKIRSQCNDAKRSISNSNEILGRLASAVEVFAHDTEIRSRSFELIKEYAAEHIGLINEMIALNQIDYDSYECLAELVEDEELIGYWILSEKERNRKLWQNEKSKAERYEAQANNPALPTSVQLYLSECAAMCYAMADFYYKLYVYWLKKEEKYDRIETNTSGLFVENMNTRNTLNKRIGQLQRNIVMNENYVIYNHMIYDKRINKIISLEEWEYGAAYTYRNRDGYIVTEVWDISDADFTNSNAMSQEDINKLLNSKNKRLVLQGYDVAIYHYSCKCGLNPKVLLATMWTESYWGLTSDNVYGLGKYSKSMDAWTQTEIASKAFMDHYRKGTEDLQNGEMSMMTVNKNEELSKKKKHWSNKEHGWIDADERYSEYMKEGAFL